MTLLLPILFDLLSSSFSSTTFCSAGRQALRQDHFYSINATAIQYHTIRGGTFSKSLVFQAISNVVVIGHDIFALLLCQFFNLGPHPAKLLFGFFSFFGPNKPTGRKCCSGIMSNFFNFLNLFWHYYLIGNIQDHFGAIQTPSRHP